MDVDIQHCCGKGVRENKVNLFIGNQHSEEAAHTMRTYIVLGPTDRFLIRLRGLCHNCHPNQALLLLLFTYFIYKSGVWFRKWICSDDLWEVGSPTIWRNSSLYVLGQKVLVFWTRLGTWILSRIDEIQSDCFVDVQQGTIDAELHHFYPLHYSLLILQAMENIVAKSSTQQDNVLFEYPMNN